MIACPVVEMKFSFKPKGCTDIFFNLDECPVIAGTDKGVVHMLIPAELLVAENAGRNI